MAVWGTAYGVMWDGNGGIGDGNVRIGPRPVQRWRARDVATRDGNVRVGPRPVPPTHNTPHHPRNTPTPSAQHPTPSTQRPPPRHSRVGGNLDAHSTNHSANATSDLAGARVFLCIRLRMQDGGFPPTRE